MLPLDKLKTHVPDAVLAQIPDCAAKFGIDSPLRLTHFLAQCAHESDWTVERSVLGFRERVVNLRRQRAADQRIEIRLFQFNGCQQTLVLIYIDSV